MKLSAGLVLPTEISEGAFSFIETVLAFDQDFTKWQAGNKSAGVRARKALMSIKKAAAAIKAEMKKGMPDIEKAPHNED